MNRSYLVFKVTSETKAVLWMIYYSAWLAEDYVSSRKEKMFVMQTLPMEIIDFHFGVEYDIQFLKANYYESFNNYSSVQRSQVD